MAKHRMTISVDERLYQAHRLGNRNASEYLNGLLSDKLLEDNRERLVDKVSNEIRQELDIDTLSERLDKLDKQVNQLLEMAGRV